MDLQMQFDTKQLEAGIEDFINKAPRAASSSLFIEGEKIIGDSKERYVPVLDAVLKSSGYVAEPTIESNSVTVEIGFGGEAKKYAAKVHENPRAGKTGGVSPSGQKYKRWATIGGWKYLEIPINEARGGFVERVGQRFWERIGKS